MYALDAVACELLVVLPISGGIDRVLALQEHSLLVLPAAGREQSHAVTMFSHD